MDKDSNPLETDHDLEEINELIKNLEEQRSNYEKQGEFLEAEKTHQRILQLKRDHKDRREAKLLDRQNKALEELDNTFNEEFKNFNDDWDSRMEKYREECKELENQLKQKQENEYETTKKSLEDSIPIIPKHSSEFLNLKRIQDTLVTKHEYVEAHAIQQQMIELEEKEKENWGQDRDSQIKQGLAALQKRQDNELQAFRQKAKNGFDEMKKTKAVEMESLLKKYQNIKKEMQNAHRREKNRFDGKHTTGSGIFISETTGTKSVFSGRATFSGRSQSGTFSMRPQSATSRSFEPKEIS
ncbi:unnamed protein product [Blepharisma stoltei]|uniref:Uncharacterized protein n=1 Tax=Blepharisma stoltei TaxID=1481888 RepID=A0AAU9JY62_9CILI|nr:unnamed protein product [Blepharisma stoltei]